MAKFCTSCGAQIADDAGFCTSCGATQNQQGGAQPAQGGGFAQNATNSVKQTFDGVTINSVMDAMTIDNIKNVGKTKNKNTIIGLCAIAVALILVIIILALVFGGGGAYTKPVDNFIKAVEKEDVKALKKAYPEYLIEHDEDMVDEWFDDEYDDVDEYYEDILKRTLDYLEDEYGSNVKITYKVKDKDSIKEKKLNELEKQIKEDYDEKVKITKGYELKLEMKVKGKEDDDVETTRIKVYKIDGKWCITGDFL